MISCPNHAISVHLAADLPTPFQSRLSDERTTCLSHVSLFVSHSFKRPNQLMKKQTKTQTGVYCTLSFREIVLCFLSFSVIKEGSEPHIISLDVVQWLPPAIIICTRRSLSPISRNSAAGSPIIYVSTLPRNVLRLQINLPTDGPITTTTRRHGKNLVSGWLASGCLSVAGTLSGCCCWLLEKRNKH